MQPNIKKKIGQWKSFDDINGLGHYCWHFLEDRDGNLWVATFDGLSRYDGKRFVNFTTMDGLAYDHVFCTHQDREGNIWVGTGDGLSRYDGKRFINFTTKYG
jgi:ligand-binding sensor domain-containing protein